MKVELIKAITKELRLKPGLHRSGRKESVIADFLTVVILQLIRQGWAFNNVEGRWCSSQTQRTTFAHKLWFRFETAAFLSMGYIESLSHRCSMLRASLCLHKGKEIYLCRLRATGGQKGKQCLVVLSTYLRPCSRGRVMRARTTCPLAPEIPEQMNANPLLAWRWF